jgi:hypothetical protein
LWVVAFYPESSKGRRVAIDENEGVVKRHLFAAMLCSTAWISEKVEDRSLLASRQALKVSR